MYKAALALSIPLPFDLGPLFDDLKYMALHTVANVVWLIHGDILTISYYIHAVAQVMTRGVLRLATQVIVDFIASSGLYGAAAAIAIGLVGLSLAASYIQLRVVDVRKVIGYGILASAILYAGPQFMVGVEQFRKDAARAIAHEAYNAVRADSEFANLVGGLRGPAQEWSSFPGLRTYYGMGGAHDAALSVLEVEAGEEMQAGLPAAFEAGFFPYTSLSAMTNAGSRATAVENATHGLLRLVMSLPLSAVALAESITELLFSVAGFFLLASLPLAVVFGFFLHTESIVYALIQRYLTLVVNYLVVSLLLTIGTVALELAAGRLSITAALAGSVLCGVFNAFAFGVAKNAALASFSALSGAVAQTLGVNDPAAGAFQTVQKGVGLGVGVAGAGLALAAGLPGLAPAALQAGGAGDPGEARAKGLVRGGLAAAGGMLMRGTALEGPATSLASILSQGDGQPVDEMVDSLTAPDAMLAGMAARGGNPFAMYRAMQNAANRRGRRKGEAAGAPDNGGPSVAGDAAEGAGPMQGGWLPTTYQADPSSPWRLAVDGAIGTYGQRWADRIAEALAQTVRQMRAEGLSEAQIAGAFVNRKGYPSLQSEGGQRMLAGLPEEMAESLQDKQARIAAAGIVGEGVMPRIGVPRQALADAVAAAVSSGAERGAEAVAAHLGVPVSALGSSYGTINAVVRQSQGMGLTPGQLGQVLSGNLSGDMQHDPAMAQLAARAGMLPASINGIQVRLGGEQ